jgi:hypothetical protein
LNFQWKNHSIFKNFYITSPNIMKPSQCTPPHRELPKIPRTQCEVHQFGGSYSYKTKQTTCLYIYIYNFIFIFILFFWRVIGTIPISPKTKKNQENSKTLHVHCLWNHIKMTNVCQYFNIYANDFDVDVKMPNMTNLKDQMNTNYIWIKIIKIKKTLFVLKQSFNFNLCKFNFWLEYMRSSTSTNIYAHGDHFSCAFL